MRAKLSLSSQLKAWFDIGISLLVLTVSVPGHAEMATLFTTAQERQIINANRYKNEISTAVKEAPKIEAALSLIAKNSEQETVNKAFDINGISISSDGNHNVWLNQQMYEDGENIDGKFKLKIYTDKIVRVRITAPDGKQYFGSSGDTVELIYKKPAQ